MELAWCGSLVDLVESGSNAVDRVSEFGWFDQRNNQPPGGREDERDSTSGDPKRASAALSHPRWTKVDLVRSTGCPQWPHRARGGMDREKRVRKNLPGVRGGFRPVPQSRHADLSQHLRLANGEASGCRRSRVVQSEDPGSRTRRWWWLSVKIWNISENCSHCTSD